MYAPLARSDYYETSAPPDGPRPATGLPAVGPAVRRRGRPRAVPTFTPESIEKGGARLYPDSLAMPTPQTFGMTSPPDLNTGFIIAQSAHLRTSDCFRVLRHSKRVVEMD